MRRYADDPNSAPAEIIAAAAAAAAAMKDAAVPDASQDLIAVIEADCLCEPGWQAALHREMADKPYLDGKPPPRTALPD